MGPVWVSLHLCSDQPRLVEWGSHCTPVSAAHLRGRLKEESSMAVFISSCFGWVSTHCHQTELTKTATDSLGGQFAPHLSLSGCVAQGRDQLDRRARSS